MKTTTITALMLLSVLTFSSVLKADDIILPVISKPATLDEGTQRELSSAQITELLPWAKNSKNFLVDLLDNVQDLGAIDKIDRLTDGIKMVVADSTPKNSELLMRYALNRALVVTNILNSEMDANAVGTTDAKTRVLILSIKMALKYYDADMSTISKKTASPFAAFGADYFTFLTELNKSIFDASAEYNIQRTSLEWLQWDLYRDLTSAQFASQILKINNALKTFPTKKISDAQAISYIRQMKRVSDQLNILEKREVNNDSEVNVHLKSTGDNDYESDSSGYCYALSTTGDRMRSVSADYCLSGKYKSDSSGYCYALSNDGDKMKSVSGDYCLSGNYKSDSSGYCYALSTTGDRMRSVSADYCLSGKFKSDSSGYCYALSKDGDKMRSVNADYCM
ncbi:MAG: hypothetical protein PHY93_00260 [Bacteriovorax sp.]|nr:hypothetical protein [Bacteriovorax sp.]